MTDQSLSIGGRTEIHEPRFRLIPFDAIGFDTTPSYLVKGLVPRVGLTVVWGPPKCGKSFFVFDLVMHVALGWSYRGSRVRQGGVVYCALEGAEGFRTRAEAFRQARMADDAALVPFHLVASPMALVADHPEFIDAIRLTLGDVAPAAIVIDTLNRSLAGSESDDRDMAAYVHAADAIRNAFTCAVIVVHHCGHEGSRPRGHSSLMGAVDAQLAVKRDPADNIVVSVEFMKDGPITDAIVSQLEPVEVGIDDDGDPMTSCVIVPVEGITQQIGAGSQKLPPASSTSLRALHEAVDESGFRPPTSPHIPAGIRVVTVEQWRSQAYKLGVSASDEPRALQQAFKRSFELLTANRHVAIWDGVAWPL